MHVIVVDNRSKNFMQLLHKVEIPATTVVARERMNIQPPRFLEYREIDPAVTSVEYEPDMGVFVQFYGGFFQMFDNIHFQP